LQQQIDYPVAGGCGIVQLSWLLYRKSGHWLTVKSRLVINALLEQLRIFLMPDFQRLNG
jgi:hypothetical protein